MPSLLGLYPVSWINEHDDSPLAWPRLRACWNRTEELETRYLPSMIGAKRGGTKTTEERCNFRDKTSPGLIKFPNAHTGSRLHQNHNSKGSDCCSAPAITDCWHLEKVL